MAKKKESDKDEMETGDSNIESQKYADILKAYADNPGMTYKEIAKMVGTSEKYVANIMSRYLSKIKSKPPEELKPIDEMEYLRRIIASTWTTTKAELIISLFQDHDPNDLRILKSLLNKAQCPKTSAELIIYSWARHRHVDAERVKEMFKHDNSLLHTFKELGYFEDIEDDTDDNTKKDENKEDDTEDIKDMLNYLKKERLKELKNKLERLQLEKEMKEMEKQLEEYEDKGKEDYFKMDEGDLNFDMNQMPSQPIMRKVVRPAINPINGEIVRDDKGNIVFETVEEPLNGALSTNSQDDTMRWIMAMQQTNKVDPEKESLKKELEDIKNRLLENEKKKQEEEERRRYEEQIKEMREQMQKLKEDMMNQISELSKNKDNDGKNSFEHELLMMLMKDRNTIPPEVMKVIEDEKALIRQLQDKPKTDEDKKELEKKIDEMKALLDKKERDEMFGKYNQYINALYSKIENLEKNITNKTALSDEKYKIDKVIEMDKSRAGLIENSMKEAREGFLEPLIKISMDQVRQQDMWNKYMMLLQEEQRRGLAPGTLIDKFFGSPRISEDEKNKLLEKIDKELAGKE